MDSPFFFKYVMAKLYFNYGVMGAGKSLFLLAKAHNFLERGIPVKIVKPSIDTEIRV